MKRLPRELERICLKAAPSGPVIAMPTAQEMGEDLDHWLQQGTPAPDSRLPAPASQPRRDGSVGNGAGYG